MHFYQSRSSLWQKNGSQINAFASKTSLANMIFSKDKFCRLFFSLVDTFLSSVQQLTLSKASITTQMMSSFYELTAKKIDGTEVKK